jgi:xanthine/CO dehydrogenase XdhC/CoxF family maturation factor
MTYDIVHEREPFGTWLANYQVRGIVDDEAAAVAQATARALLDVPEASVELWRVRQTSSGRWTVTFRRVRPRP